MATKIKISKEVKDFLTGHASIIDTFGDDGKTGRKRYFYLPYWFCMEEYKTDEVEVLGFQQLPDDLVKEIWAQRETKAELPPKPEWMKSHPYTPDGRE